MLVNSSKHKNACQLHPILISISQYDVDMRITNVLKALSSACPIICFLGMMITPTCTKFKLVNCKQSKGVNYNRKVGTKNRTEKNSSKYFIEFMLSKNCTTWSSFMQPTSINLGIFHLWDYKGLWSMPSCNLVAGQLL